MAMSGQMQTELGPTGLSPFMQTEYQQQSQPWVSNQIIDQEKSAPEGVPKPPPPVVGKVTHQSIELYWDEALVHAYSVCKKADGKIKSFLQEKDRGGQWCGAYTGYGKKHVVQGLEPLRQYTYRLRFANDVDKGECSQHVTVTTTKEPMCAEQLHKAVQRAYHDVATTILESGEVNIDTPDNLGFSALMQAARKGDAEMTELLVKFGADVNLKNSSGKTALMLACFAGQKETVKLLRDNGARYDDFDNGGSTAMHWAVDGGNAALIDWMITDGADPNICDKHCSWTPLLRCASVSGNYQVASCLLREGASINCQDVDGKTAIMIAVINKNEQLLDLLLRRNADCTVTNKWGKNVYDMALAIDRKSNIARLEKHFEDKGIKGVKRV
ncbi:fibronectin type 3 and ankyrin repeat domains 1 protein-like [Mizuhopecten yessoensis]|uniref:fibronectin type 3 and ankyrin repeat domains 1 protein-like n=1 Tax=Mizuhopecten yessoensis TaxID=6573 RepID=UPI000B45EDB4|nr:fibronectin type 3 and ankyrin repeat domains 1 protein-like [Mizuhopecten yessoensis]